MENMKKDRKYIIFLYDTDYYRFAYRELSNCEDVQVHYGFRPQNQFLRILHIIHHSLKINHVINLPFKNLWFKHYYKIDTNNEVELYFVFDARLLEFEYTRSFCDYLHTRHNNAHFICYYQDLIKTSTLESQPQNLKDKFNLLVSYDKGDADSYGIDYYPTSYSYSTIEDDDSIECCDVYFLGAAKNRWKDIVNSYKILTKKGLRCSFYITRLPKSDRLNLPGLNYIDGMSYKKNLQHIKKCKCVLELQQKGAVGPTLRTWEAICYDKFLITNNICIKESDFYDKRFVAFIDDERLDIDVINLCEPYVNTKKSLINPRNFIDFLSEKLHND